jgi:hypothetical protein
MPISKEAQRLDDMMRKVEGLLAKADDTAVTPEEADSYRAMAERIMIKYKIEQEDLIKRGDLKVDGLNVMFVQTKAYPWTSEYTTVYNSLLSYAIHHAGVKGYFEGYEDGEYLIWLIGYEADIRFAKALFMNARLVFADRMEPKYDPNLSDDENVYRMRSAGMERGRIGQYMGWGDKAHQKVTRVYKRACAAKGEDAVLTGKTTNVKDFRKAYADGFVSEFWARLSRARNAVDDEITDGGLVLHGREDRIKEAMYNRWPHLRPDETPAKVQTEVKAREYRWTKADQRRFEKQNSATARMGRQAGARAAAEIDVSNGATPRKRLQD